MRPDRASLCVTAESSIRAAAACIDSSPAKIALVVDAERHVLDTITDGDIRRAILAGLDLESSIAGLRSTKGRAVSHAPVTAPVTASPAALLRLMREQRVRQIPLLDAEQRLVDVVTIGDLAESAVLPVRAVIMAGGFGRRLAPLTDDVPKPMLPVGDRPLLELMIERLRLAGIRHVSLLTHYKSEHISAHFGDGSDFGVAIDYVIENEPLGTAGALTLLSPSPEPLLVMNGDILTRVDFAALVDFHHQHRAAITVGVREYDFRVPYGVVESDGVHVRGISEKPVVRYFVNAGIYLLEPTVCARLSHGKHCDMPTLINGAANDGEPVVSFLVHEYWLDIGHLEDYRKANVDLSTGAG